MKLQTTFTLALMITAVSAWAVKPTSISGDYLEVRTCNVYAGTCFVNGEMGLTGKEGILVWSVREGAWNGVKLDGLKVIAVVNADDTLGNQKLNPQLGKAVLLVDARANADQKAALVDWARTASGKLISQLVEVKSADLKVNFDKTTAATSVTVKAANLIDIATHDPSGHTTTCGLAEIYYPPLTDISNARIGYTEFASYKGASLGRKWQTTGLFSAYLGTFSR